MSVVVFLDLKVKPDKLDDFRDYIASVVDETRNYDGCEEMTYTANLDDLTNIAFVEKWESREKYEKYFAWRVESGALERIGPMLDGEPSPRYFEIVDM